MVPERDEDLDIQEPARELGQTVIGPRTAALLYAMLALLAVLTLKGKAMALALIIVFGLAVKSYLSHFRDKFHRAD